MNAIEIQGTIFHPESIEYVRLDEPDSLVGFKFNDGAVQVFEVPEAKWDKFAEYLRTCLDAAPAPCEVELAEPEGSGDFDSKASEWEAILQDVT